MNKLAELRDKLSIGPVMVNCHPLLPCCLDPKVRIVAAPQDVVFDLDSPAPQRDEMTLIPRIETRWADRFPIWNFPAVPGVGEIDSNLAGRLEYVRSSIPSQSAIGARLARRFIDESLDCCVLILVDGLSYFDCTDWPERPSPCFVDGPSITEFGFPAITQDSGMVREVNDTGRHRLRAYTYWEHERNDLTDNIFRGAPVRRVRNFSEALIELDKDLATGSFAIVLRQGLDHLAHRGRELSKKLEVAAVSAIRDDMISVVNLARGRGLRALVALTADHGVVWRDKRTWRVVAGGQSWHGRHSEMPPPSPAVATLLGNGSMRSYCYHPGLLCREPRADEAGFHGGLSARESFVPFVLMEVA